MHACRARIYLVFVSNALGGQAGADEIKDMVIQALRYRRVGPPTSVRDLFSALSDGQEGRLQPEQEPRPLQEWKDRALVFPFLS